MRISSLPKHIRSQAHFRVRKTFLLWTVANSIFSCASPDLLGKRSQLSTVVFVGARAERGNRSALDTKQDIPPTNV